MTQDSMVYNYVWSVNVPKDGMGWDGKVVSLSPIKKFNEIKIISKNENKQKNLCRKYSTLGIK